MKDSSYQIPHKKIEITGDTISVSKDRHSAVVLDNAKGISELWFIRGTESINEKLLILNKDKGVKSIAWSPNNKLAAFEVYNIEGHSPLTTTHVWVVNNNGKGLKEILLPNPNERFSTFNPIWKSDSTLKVSSTTIDNPAGQNFIYNYNSKKIIKLYTNNKKIK